MLLWLDIPFNLLSLSCQLYLGVDDQLLEPFLRPLTLVEEEQAMVLQVVPTGKVEKAKLNGFYGEIMWCKF